MFTLAFLTDPHLAPLPTPSIGELCSKRILGYLNWRLSRHTFHNRAVLDRLTEDLLSQKPDHVAVGGDLTNLSLRDEFAHALDWLQTLGSPEFVSVIPGNHDAYIRMKYAAGMDLWRAYMTSDVKQSPKLAPSENGFPWVRRFGKVALVGLSTAIATAPFFAAGELGAEQRSALSRVLEELRKTGFFRIVMIHHPPLIGMSGPRRGLRDVNALQAMLEKEGAELVLFGHRHFHSLSRLETAHGSLPVLGGPSASAAHGAPEELARYYLVRLDREHGDWRCELVSRGMNEPQGDIIEIGREILTA